MAVGNLILTIGSKLGPGGFASLQAAIQMLGRVAGAVKDAMAEGEKFAQVWRNLEIDISKSDKATKGLIDTYALMTNANKLTQAGLQVSARDYETLNKFVVKYAQATGQDATEASERLTTAIVSGTTVSLKRMGIEIESTGTAAGNFARVIEELEPKVANVDIEVERLGERIFVLTNNWETLIGHIAQSTSGEMGVLHLMIKDISDAIAGFSEEIEAANIQQEIIRKQAELRMQKMHFYAAMSRDALDEAEEILHRIELIDMEIKRRPWARGMVREGGLAPKAAPRSMGAVTKSFKKKPKRGGGRAADTGTTSDTPALPEFYSGAVDEKMAAMEAARAANEEWEKAEIEAQEKAIELQQEELEELKKSYSFRMGMYENELYQQDRKVEWRERELLQREEDALYYEYVMERHISMHEQMIIEERQYMVSSRKMWESGLKGKLQQTQIFMGAISSLQALENKKNFKLMKGIRASETVISGIVAAWNAYSALAGIPYVGPALGAAAAIAILIASAASASEISNMSWEDAHGPSGGGGKISKLGSGGGGGSYNGPTAGGGGGGGGDKEITINITMDDSASAWGLMVNENDMASQRGERSFKMD